MEPVDAEEIYGNRFSGDINLGPSFHTLRAFWSGEGQGVGELALRESADTSGAEFHTLLVDGCFHVFGAARYLSGIEQGALYIPFGWERLWVAGPMPDRMVCHAALRNPPSGSGTEWGVIRAARSRDRRCNVLFHGRRSHRRLDRLHHSA